MRTSAFLGKGVAFPFRVNPNTGGVATTVGIYDGTSVGLEFLEDRVTIRESLDVIQNHIAESIANILLTRQTEDDTLPEFGSNIQYLIFENNTPQFKIIARTWFENAARRWEKRASVEKGGVVWKDTWEDIKGNILPLQLLLSFILQQKEGNLVSPFVTPRQAIESEYTPGSRDSTGNDSFSRYYPSQKVATSRGKYTYFKKNRLPKFFKDDEFYKVEEGDTWRLISYKRYGDTRYWWPVAKSSIEHGISNGRGRNCIDTTQSPKPGDILRLPSRERMIMR